MTQTASPALLLEGFLAQTKEHAIVCLNADATICAWLGAAEEIFGFAEHETVGMPVAIIFTDEDRAKGLHENELEIARRDGRSEDDRWHLRRDGTKVFISGALTAVRDSHRRVIGFVKIMRDRTDLRTRVEAFESRLERTQSFLRTLGHEIRNPLAPLLSAISIIERVNSDPKAERALQIMQTQIAGLKRLADDLVDVTRLEVGGVKLELVPLDLCLMLRDACVVFDPQAKQKGIDFQTIVPSGALQVFGDPNRLQQVILNLLSNALKYTPAGGRIWVKATQEADDVVVRVEDTGIGIDPKVLPEIFELFSREAKAAATAPEGLGIGLAVVEQIVRLHGGTVEARSSGAGKGSQFCVRLPAYDSSRAPLPGAGGR